MSIGNTREWLDHDQHVEDWYGRNAEQINAYANAMIRRDQINGPQARYQDERAPDGRSLYKDNQGYYRATREEIGK